MLVRTNTSPVTFSIEAIRVVNQFNHNPELRQGDVRAMENKHNGHILLDHGSIPTDGEIAFAGKVDGAGHPHLLGKRHIPAHHARQRGHKVKIYSELEGATMSWLWIPWEIHSAGEAVMLSGDSLEM